MARKWPQPNFRRWETEIEEESDILCLGKTTKTLTGKPVNGEFLGRKPDVGGHVT